MIQATQIKRGMTIKHNNALYRVFSFQHITPEMMGQVEVVPMSEVLPLLQDTDATNVL